MSKEKSGADVCTIELGGYEIQVSLDYQAQVDDSDDGPGEDESITITGLEVLAPGLGHSLGAVLKAILEDIPDAMGHIETLCWAERERNGEF
jgi:hypothetical protein